MTTRYNLEQDWEREPTAQEVINDIAFMSDMLRQPTIRSCGYCGEQISGTLRDAFDHIQTMHGGGASL